MDHQPMNDHTRAGTIGGIVMVLLFKVRPEELLSSALIAAVGACVSFGISHLLKRIFKDRKTK
ncbi:MAG: hypothetical protein ABIP30_16705 [Ferruginibacter sp.]